MKKPLRNRWRGLVLSLLGWVLLLPAVLAGVGTSPASFSCPVSLSVSVVDNAALCAGKPVKLMAHVPTTPFGNWYWTKNGQKYGYDQQTYLSVDQAGTYTLGGDWQSNPCYTAPNKLNVSLSATDALTLTLSPTSALICEGESTTLEAKTGTLAGYHWTHNGVDVPNSTNRPTLDVREAGVYSLTGNFATCTEVEKAATIERLPRPTLSVVPSRLTFCEGETAQLDVQTDAANTLRWQQTGSPVSTARSLTANAAGTYSLTATSPAGCSQTATYAFAPTVHPIPMFTLLPAPASGPPLGTSPSTAPLDPTYRYQWTPADGLSDPTAARPLFRPGQTTLYTLTITSKGGCQHSDTLRIVVVPTDQLGLATAFTPNGDGQNDTWQPANFEKHPDAELVVYNRLGQVVFAARPGQPPFDGRVNGDDLPTGVYTYRLYVPGQQPDRRGSVLLLR